MKITNQIQDLREEFSNSNIIDATTVGELDSNEMESIIHHIKTVKKDGDYVISNMISLVFKDGNVIIKNNE